MGGDAVADADGSGEWDECVNRVLSYNVRDMTTTSYHHIDLDAQSVPWISGANVKVVEIVAEKLAYDWNAEQIQEQHPQLTLAQV